jgi:hypothetical protein
MSLRTSIILLSLAFGALVAIVLATLFAASPRETLQTELEQRRHDLKTAPVAPVYALPDLRDAPRSKCSDLFKQECRNVPVSKPATFAR